MTEGPMMNYPITDNRCKIVHYSCGPVPAPLCKPRSRVKFRRVLVIVDMAYCQTCATAELRSR